MLLLRSIDPDPDALTLKVTRNRSSKYASADSKEIKSFVPHRSLNDFKYEQSAKTIEILKFFESLLNALYYVGMNKWINCNSPEAAPLALFVFVLTGGGFRMNF